MVWALVLLSRSETRAYFILFLNVLTLMVWSRLGFSNSGSKYWQDWINRKTKCSMYALAHSLTGLVTVRRSLTWTQVMVRSIRNHCSMWESRIRLCPLNGQGFGYSHSLNTWVFRPLFNWAPSTGLCPLKGRNCIVDRTELISLYRVMSLKGQELYSGQNWIELPLQGYVP